jgi:hypothetical protein
VNETATAAKPLEAVIESDVKVILNEEAKTALRKQGIRDLHEAQTRLEAAFLDLPQLDGQEARDALEELGTALAEARTAVDVLWWVAPGDNE